MAGSALQRQRRALLRGCGGAALAAWLPACRAPPPLQVMAHDWPGYQFMFLAGQLGFLDKAQVRLKRSRNMADTVSALREGQVQAAAMTLDEALGLRARIPVHVVLVFNSSAGADALLARPGIDSLQALRGKRIAVEKSSLGGLMLAKVLKAADLQPDEVEVVSYVGDQVQAWQQHQPLDAIISYEPSLSGLVAQGLVSRFDSREIPQTIIDVLVVRSEALSVHDDALRVLVGAHFRAQHDWLTNPMDAAYRLGALMGVEPDAVAGHFRGLDLPDALYNRKYLAPPASALVAAARDVADAMIESGWLQARPDLEGFFLSDYLPSVTA